MILTQSGLKLAEAIKKAIEDHVITTGEYEQILAMADADYHIDRHEQRLLAELKNMITDGVVRRSA